MWAIQMVEPFDSLNDAQSAFDALKLQDGFLGGRVLLPSAVEPDHRVQAFFQDEPEAGEWLPDGMRRVFVPAGVRQRLGLPPEMAPEHVVEVGGRKMIVGER